MHLPEPKKNGFTLIEILVSVSIIGILFGMGLINWNRSIQKQKIINAREKIETQLHEGFSTSRSQGKSVKIYGNAAADFFCVNENKEFESQTCSESCSTATEEFLLEGNTNFSEKFCIIYKNAFGDLDQKSDTKIQLESGEFTSELSINLQSGLITTYPITLKTDAE